MNSLLEKAFSFQIIETKKLNGYESENYLIKTVDNQYIFKKYPYSEDLKSLIQAENKVLLFLSQKYLNRFPNPIKTIDGFYVKILIIEGEKYICRMLSFLDGKFFGEVKHTKKMLESFGLFLAEMNLQLMQFNNDTIKARKSPWDIQYLHLNKKYIDDIENAKDRSLVQYFFNQFEENVVPLIPSLRKSIIHNDTNEWNVLIKNGKISSVIDFGDLAYSSLINEVAIAMMYASYDKEDPLEWAVIILKSYHKLLPLQEDEISILYYLIATKLCISVCNSAHSRKVNPNNEYALVSEESAWRMLHEWLVLSPLHVENTFRKSLGLLVHDQKPLKEIIKRRHQVISPIFSLSYDKPVRVERAAFQYIYDVYGKTYLDAYNNIPHVGHSHPRVVSSGKKQMSKLNINTRYLYDLLPEYAEKLLIKFPNNFNKIYFVNSGSEASDLAIKLAFSHTKLDRVMVVENGYHGHTQRGTDISDYKFSNKKGQGQKDYIIKAPMPNIFNGKYTNNDGQAGRMYATDAIKNMKNSGSSVSAFISEPILGCGGQVILAKGYLKEIYSAIRSQGGVCISDEVQTGFGRLGHKFWGFEMHDVVPDIVIIGKPMANGHPIGAVVTTSKIAESFSKGVEFFSSFGGNPVSCAIGMSVLDVIEEENLQENAKVVGTYYMSLLKDLQNKHACIGDVRGSGLFIGIEVVKENSKEPDTKLAQRIKNELRNMKILVGTDGPFNNVIKSKPPLCFTKENAESVVRNIELIINTL
jgi:4-aminobutyrate aminotransferase-like enzyme/Ser/Thr protein kinase RdoA (MazF antagonist)